MAAGNDITPGEYISHHLTNLTIGDMESRLASRVTDPQVSTILLMGRFDFWGKGAAGKPAASRGRPRRS